MSEQIGWEIAKVAITAVVGFGGVWYAQWKLARKDAKQAALETQKAEQERAFVASVVIEHLERYINGCVSVAYDDGTDHGEPAGENGFYQATTTPPEFEPRKLDVNLRILPSDLIYDILAIGSRKESIQNYLDSPGFDDPPDFSEFFWERGLMFARHAQQVIEIALRLRKACGLPNEVLTKGDWSRDKGLAEVIEKTEAHQARRDKLHRESMAKLFAHAEGVSNKVEEEAS